MGQFEHGKLFRELIIDAALSSGSRVVTGDLDATHGVANVEETARLSSLAVNGERLSDGRLNTKAIQDGAKDIIVVEAIDHRVGSRALLREMDRGFRFEGLKCGSEKVVVGNVTDIEFDGLAGQVLPNPDAIRQRANRSQRLRTKLVVPKAPQKVVNDRDRMALLRQIDGRSPTAIAVPTEHGNLHVPSSGQISVQISAAIRTANDSP